MARDGAGTFNLPEAPFVYDTVIDESAVNSNFSDIATALTQSLAKDGQTVPTSNLPMGTYKHTGVGNSTSRTDYAASGQVQDSAFLWCGTAGGTADALALTVTPSIAAYAAGQTFRFIAADNNTGAATVTVSGLTAKAVQNDGAALSAADIATGKLYQITYDGTAFQLSRVRLGSVLTASDASVTVGGTTSAPTVKVTDLGITTTKIAALAVETAKINDLAVTTTKIAALAVETAKLADSAVTTTKIADLAIETAKLSAGAVTTVKLADLNVTTTKIAALAVETAKLADSAVTTTKIANLAVETAKIANDAVTFAKLQNISTSKLLGRSTSGTGDVEEITVGSGLSLSAGALSTTGGSGGGAPGYNDIINSIRIQAAVSPGALLYNGFADAFNTSTWAGSVTGFTYDSTNHWYSNAADPYFSNVTRLWNFNSDLTDSSGNGGTLTGVNTSIDTSVKKWGAGSLRLTGGSAYAYAATGGALGSGDFTVDFWLYVDAISSYQTVFGTNPTAGSTAGLHLSVGPTGALIPYSNGQLFATTTTIVAATWYFVRMRRSGTTLKIYINGVDAGGSATTSLNFSHPSIYIGRYEFAAAEYFTGRIDDARITVGVARDGAELPTAEFSGSATVSPCSLISTSPQAATSEPTTCKLWLAYEDVASAGITLNTELVGKVSIDNGATWATGTLTDAALYATGIKMAVAEIDVTSQTGTTPKYEIDTNTSDSLRIHAVGLLWS